MKIQSFVTGILMALVATVAAEEMMTEPSMLRGGKGSEHLSTANVQESSRSLNDDEGVQIKYRYDTEKCLTAEPGKLATFVSCAGVDKDPWQYWVLQQSYLKSSYRRDWCLTYIPDDTRNLLLLKCAPPNNLQRFHYNPFLRFQSFYDIDKCLEYSTPAELEGCEDLKQTQSFLFRYD